MKNFTLAFLLWIALLSVECMFGQWIKIPDKEYTTLTIGIDPYASYKEKGINLIGEFTLVSYFGYVKIVAQIFPALTGGYYDATGGVGFNQESAIFGVETRLYEGIRGGINYRGNSDEFGKGQSYPLFGVDLGVDFKITERFSLGLRATNDWREDMKYSCSNPCWVQSGFLTASFKL